VGGGQKSDSSQTLRCEKVATREFNPSRAFVQRLHTRYWREGVFGGE
jgi:hypothetical protein